MGVDDQNGAADGNNQHDSIDRVYRSHWVYGDVQSERMRAHEQHSTKEGASMEEAPWSHPGWLPFVSEQHRAVTRDILGARVDDAPDVIAVRLRGDLVRLAAITCAWIAAIDER